MDLKLVVWIMTPQQRTQGSMKATKKSSRYLKIN